MSVPYAMRVFSAIPRAFRWESKARRWAPHVASCVVDRFFIDTQTGRVGVHRQLVEAGGAEEGGLPARAGFPSRAERDASTLWYAVMRKRERGVYIGPLCIRHTSWHASLLDK